MDGDAISFEGKASKKKTFCISVLFPTFPVQP